MARFAFIELSRFQILHFVSTSLQNDHMLNVKEEKPKGTFFHKALIYVYLWLLVGNGSMKQAAWSVYISISLYPFLLKPPVYKSCAMFPPFLLFQKGKNEKNSHIFFSFF